MEKHIKPINEQINEIKSNLINVALLLMIIFIIPGIIVSTLRIKDTGLQPAIVYLYLGAIVLFIIYPLRKRISYKIRGGFFIGFFLLFGFVALRSYGLLAVGTWWLILASAFSAMYFNKRTSYIISGISISGLLFFAFAFSSRWLVFNFDVTTYATSKYSWGAAIVGITFIITILTFSFNKIYDLLIFKQQELFNQNNSLKEINIRLEEEIEFRKATEEILQKSDAYLKALFDSAGDAVLVLKKDKFIDCNKKALSFFNCNKEQLIGRTPWDVSPLFQHDGKNSAEKAAELIQNTFGRNTIQFEWLHTKFTGEVFDVEVTLSPVLEEKNLLIAILRDISYKKKTEEQLKLQEEHFRLMVENMPVLINAFDANGNFIFWNKECERVTGYKASEVIGSSDVISKLYPERTYKKEKIDAYHGKWEEIKNAEIDLINKEGKLCTIVWTNINKPVPLKNWAGWEVGVEITNLKRVEHELRENEEKYRLIIENVPIVIWKSYANGETNFISDNVEQIYGFTPDEIYKNGKKYWLDRIHPEDLDMVLTSFNNLFTKNIPFNVKYRIKTKTEKWIWLHDLADNVIEENGTKYAYGVFHDITNQKNAELLLKESEENYRRIFETIEDGYILTTLDGEVKSINPAASTMLGYENPEYLINKNFVEDLYAIKEQKNVFNKILEKSGGKIKGYIIELKHKSGKTIIADCNIHYVYNEDQKPVAIEGTFRDLTERIQDQKQLIDSEEKYRTIIENMPIACFTFDKQGNFLSWNKEAENIYKFTSEEIIGKNYYNLISTEQTIAETKHMIKAIFDGEIFRDSEWQDKDKYGNLGWRIGNSFPISDSDNKVECGVNMNIDITKRKQAEQDLLESTERYKRLSEATFEAIAISRNGKMIDVNNQIHAIYGYTPEEFVRKDFVELIHPDDVEKVLNNIRNEVSVPYIHRGIKKDGSTLYLEIHAKTITINNEKHRLTVIKDITSYKNIELSLRSSEEKFRNFFNSVSEAIFIIDFDEKILEVNDMAVQQYGYTKEEFYKLHPKDLVVPEYYRELRTRNEDFESIGFGTFESVHFTKEGKKFLVETSIKNIIHNGEKAIIALCKDITERKQIQKRIYEVMVEAEELERERYAKELHDGLGPILSTCKIYFHSLNPEKGNLKNKEYLSRAGELLEEALQSIKEISNNLSPHILRNYGLEQALLSFIDKLKNVTKINFSINSKLEVRLPEIIEFTLYRTLAELINNSIKYSHAKNISINIEQQNNTLNIRYEDNGKGFDYKKTLEQNKGFGLLNLENRINKIDGIYQYNSSPGEGVKVNILLNLNTKYD